MSTGVSPFFAANTITPTAKWEAAKQRAPEPPLFWPPQPRKAQREDVVLSLPEHRHKWRELLVAEQLPCTWPIETHFYFQNAHNFTDHLYPQPSNITFWGNSFDNFPLTLGHLSSIFRASLGDRLEVGRMTLDHATGVRILLPQPLPLWRLSVIGYWLHVEGKENRVYVPLDTYSE